MAKKLKRAVFTTRLRQLSFLKTKRFYCLVIVFLLPLQGTPSWFLNSEFNNLSTEDKWDHRQASFVLLLIRSWLGTFQRFLISFGGCLPDADLGKWRGEPGVSMYRSVPDASWSRTSAGCTTWARWCCSSVAPPHQPHLFIYLEATFSSVQQDKALWTLRSKHCPAPFRTQNNAWNIYI